MARYDFDLFTLGAGSGGVRASRVAAAGGVRCAVAESRYLGGTCVNVGCVPKKLMVYAAQLGEAFDDAGGFGWCVGRPGFDWSVLIENKDREIARLNEVYRGLLVGAGVELFEGAARLLDRHTVEVNGQRLTAEHVLVATGGKPSMLAIPGSELTITSDDVFSLPELPKRVLIVGGGYIAVEFAGIFNGLGSEVTLHYRGPLFLRGFDDDIRTRLAEEQRVRGIRLQFECCPTSVEAVDGGLRVSDSLGGITDVDQVLMAVGRVPNTMGIGLEAAGVKLAPTGAVEVDELSRTSVSNIYAIGDCTDRVNLTPVALAEGMAFVRTVFGGQPTPVDYQNIPSAIFSAPNAATVGLTEAEARLHHRVVVFRSTFRPMKHTLSGRDEKTMMKLVVDGDDDRVLGVHMVGPEAGEIVQGLAVAVKCGVTKAGLDSTIGIHPTAAEEFVTMREPLRE